MYFFVCILAGIVHLESDEGQWIGEDGIMEGQVSITVDQAIDITADTFTLKGQKEMEFFGNPKVTLSWSDRDLWLEARRAKLTTPVEVVELFDDVFIAHKSITLEGDRVTFHFEDGEPKKLKMASLSNPCHFSYEWVKALDFEKGSFDLQKQLFIFEMGSGQLQWKGYTIPFQADWIKVEEEEKVRVVLDGHILFEGEGGQLMTTGPMIATFDQKKEQLEQLVVEGKSEFRFLDRGSKSYLVYLEGAALYDALDQRLLLETKAKEGLKLRHPSGVVVAKRGVIHFNPNSQGGPVEKIELEGEVFASHTLETDQEVEPLQYLLANKCIVFPEKKCLTLLGVSGEKVLVFDSANGVNMSAKVVDFFWGDKKGEETIKGKGDVHFSFNQEELEKIHESLKSH